MLDQVQFLQQYMAGGIRRRFVNSAPPVGRRNWLLPFHPVIGEILFRQDAARLLGEGHDGVGDRAFVKRVPPMFRDQLVGFGEVRIAPDLSRLQRYAVRREDRGRCGKAVQKVLALRQLVLKMGLRNAFQAKLDSWLNAVRQRQPPMTCVRGKECIADTRHRDGENTAVLDPAREPFRRRGHRRGAGAVRDGEGFFFLHVDHHEAVGCNAGALRLGNAQRKADGDRRVDRIATTRQNAHARHRGQGMVRHHGSLRAHPYRRPGLGFNPRRCFHHDTLQMRTASVSSITLKTRR